MVSVLKKLSLCLVFYCVCDDYSIPLLRCFFNLYCLIFFVFARGYGRSSQSAATQCLRGYLSGDFCPKLLEDMPERCPYYDNPYIRNGKYRKLSLGNNLLILFQIVNYVVYIELIIDARAENIHLF